MSELDGLTRIERTRTHHGMRNSKRSAAASKSNEKAQTRAQLNKTMEKKLKSDSPSDAEAAINSRDAEIKRLGEELDEMTARAISLAMHIPPETLAADIQQWRDDVKAKVAIFRNIASESTRKHVRKTIIAGDVCVVCPNCERTDILSGGWPGTECSEGWRCKCECGQKMLVVGHLKSQREAAGTADETSGRSAYNVQAMAAPPLTPQDYPYE